MITVLPSLVFLIEMTILYLLSRRTIEEIFRLLSSITRKRSTIFVLISIIFFPGTVFHEVAHLIMAMVLMLKVRDIKIFPELEGNHIKLGKVLYERQDVIRGIIVGIAPVIAGIFFFWLIANLDQSYGGNIYVKLALIYAMFMISSTMFSSKQDLVDIVYLIPFILIIGALLYVLNIPVLGIIQAGLAKINNTLLVINQYLFYSFIIHIALILIGKSLRKILIR